MLDRFQLEAGPFHLSRSPLGQQRHHHYHECARDMPPPVGDTTVERAACLFGGAPTVVGGRRFVNKATGGGDLSLWSCPIQFGSQFSLASCELQVARLKAGPAPVAKWRARFPASSLSPSLAMIQFGVISHAASRRRRLSRRNEGPISCLAASRSTALEHNHKGRPHTLAPSY